MNYTVTFLLYLYYSYQYNANEMTASIRWHTHDTHIYYRVKLSHYSKTTSNPHYNKGKEETEATRRMILYVYCTGQPSPPIIFFNDSSSKLPGRPKIQIQQTNTQVKMMISQLREKVLCCTNIRRYIIQMRQYTFDIVLCYLVA